LKRPIIWEIDVRAIQKGGQDENRNIITGIIYLDMLESFVWYQLHLHFNDGEANSSQSTFLVAFLILHNAGVSEPPENDL
jgi:hypothetical protein